MTDNWICYLIYSLDSNATYIGSTNNSEKRLKTHNLGRGAKYTRGQTWIPIMIVSGFHHKNACLSFESGWKRLNKTRNNKRLHAINLATDLNLKYYPADTKWNRIMDLLYFVNHFTLLDTKFKLNVNTIYPLNSPRLTIHVFMETWIKDLPWPYFIDVVNDIYKN